MRDVWLARAVAPEPLLRLRRAWERRDVNAFVTLGDEALRTTPRKGAFGMFDSLASADIRELALTEIEGMLSSRVRVWEGEPGWSDLLESLMVTTVCPQYREVPSVEMKVRDSFVDIESVRRPPLASATVWWNRLIDDEAVELRALAPVSCIPVARRAWEECTSGEQVFGGASVDVRLLVAPPHHTLIVVGDQRLNLALNLAGAMTEPSRWVVSLAR